MLLKQIYVIKYRVLKLVLIRNGLNNHMRFQKGMWNAETNADVVNDKVGRYIETLVNDEIQILE